MSLCVGLVLASRFGGRAYLLALMMTREREEVGGMLWYEVLGVRGGKLEQKLVLLVVVGY